VDATPARIEALLAHKRAAFARRAQTAGLYSGVAETLRRLHPHFILAIASGAFRDEIEPILERAQVRPLFSAVVGADDVSRGKPAPDPFLCALRALGATHDLQVSAAECIVIEDAPRGIEAAHAAGMRCIAVTTHYDRAALAAADAVVTHVNQLRAEDLGR
jgi:beta-phosphoglucomutase